MTTQNETQVEQVQIAAEEGGAKLSEAVGQLLLAAIGSVGLAQDSLGSLFRRMVQRGEISQMQVQKLAATLKQKRPRLPHDEMQKKIEIVLEEAESPMKADIQSLHDQIAALTAKVEQLEHDREEISKQAQSKGPVK